METPIKFMFRGKQYGCIVNVDSSSNPCYAFIELQDDKLIAEFGKDISVKTDFKNRLSKKDDYPALVEIRESIFAAIKELPEFKAATNKRELLQNGSSGLLGQHGG